MLHHAALHNGVSKGCAEKTLGGGDNVLRVLVHPLNCCFPHKCCGGWGGRRCGGVCSGEERGGVIIGGRGRGSGHVVWVVNVDHTCT